MDLHSTFATVLGSALVPLAGSGRARLLYEKAAESYFGVGCALAFWKARVALYAILKALGLRGGDEVIVPGYTCVVVPAAVMYAGARPIYADIEPLWFNIRPEEVAAKLSPRTKAIIVQHTYGFPAQTPEILDMARARGIPVIEDCCHTFGGRAQGQLLGTFGDASFFSSQWNKTFTTGLGGLALVADPKLAQGVRLQQGSYPLPSARTLRLLAVQFLAYELFASPSLSLQITRVFRALTRRGLVVGSSSEAELKPDQPASYAFAAARFQTHAGRIALQAIEHNIEHRRRNAAFYRKELPKMGFPVREMPDEWDPVLVRFPLRVRNKEEVLARAETARVEIGSWFEVPLHPRGTDHAAFGYEIGTCSVAEQAAAEVINLPVHPRARPEDLQRTLDFVRAHCVPAT